MRRLRWPPSFMTAIQVALELNCVGEQALSSLIGLSGGAPLVATMAIGSTGYEPIAWWLAREGIGRNLRERYAVSEELPPSLITLVKKLDAVEGNQLFEEL